MARVTIEDVALEAGLSVATVDRVLNGRAAVRPQTALRVEKAIRHLNYQPDRLATRLAKGQEYRFCFVLPEGNNGFMTMHEANVTKGRRYNGHVAIAVKNNTFWRNDFEL